MTWAIVAALLSGDVASGPVGVYALIDKVEFEPAEGAPERVILRGVFITLDDHDAKKSAGPVQGVLYYAVGDHWPEGVRAEWEELKKAAGTDQVVAFGSMGSSNGTVRRATETLKDADQYQLNVGVVTFADGEWTNTRGRKLGGRVEEDLVKKVKAAPRIVSPVDGETIEGKLTLTVRNIIEPKTARYKFTFEGKESTVEAGKERTEWTPDVELKAGQKYSWTVQAIDKDWSGPIMTGTFSVKK